MSRAPRLVAAAAAVLVVFVAGAAGSGARDPSFAPGAPIAGAWLGAVGDFNADHRPDLAVTRSDSVAILLGSGGGRFSPAPVVAVKSGYLPVAADFNGDGKLDVAVVTDSNTLAVLLGDGAGGFLAAPGPSPKASGGSLAIADVDGDGKLDLVVSGLSKVSVLLGDGSGRFSLAPGSPFAGGEYLTGVALADFDGDRRPDLALGDYESKNVLIRRGTGGGRFASATKVPLPGGQGVAALGVADLNRDGKPDLVVGSAYDGKSCSVPCVTTLLGTGRGGFRAGGAPIELHGTTRSIAVADLDGNRLPDLAVASVDGDYSDSDGFLALLLGSGKGRLRAAADSPFRIDASEVAAADVDGDGKIELVASGAAGVTILARTRPAPVAAAGRDVPGRRTPFSIPSTVGLLAAEGRFVVAATCQRVIVWDALRRKSVSFTTPAFRCNSSRGGLVDAAVGDGQVAWIVTSGGNTEQSELFVAPLAGGKPKRVDSASPPVASNESGDELGRLLGAEKVLAYNTWSFVCSRKNPDDGSCAETRRAGERLVRLAAGRRTVVKRGVGSFPLTAAGGARTAVVSDGALTVLRAGGSRGAVVSRLAEEPTRAVALSRSRLAIQRTFSLDLYDAARGKKTKSLPLGPAAALQLAGLSDRLALLVGSRRVVLVRLGDGKLVSLPLHGVLGPTLTEAGLFYAYNTPKTALKAHVVFEPTAKLLRRF